MEISEVFRLLNTTGAGIVAGFIAVIIAIRYGIQIFKRDAREYNIDAAYRGIIEDLRSEVIRLQQEVARLQGIVQALTRRLSEGE